MAKRPKFQRPKRQLIPPVFQVEGKPRCRDCKYYVFTKTLGSPDTPVWHCRDGFSPRQDQPKKGIEDCRKMAMHNDWATALYQQEHAQQLTLFEDL